MEGPGSRWGRVGRGVSQLQLVLARQLLHTLHQRLYQLQAGPSGRRAGGSLMRLPLLLLVAAIPVHPMSHDMEAHVWYGMGHRLIARIAESRLTPHTADAVRSLLAGQ